MGNYFLVFREIAFVRIVHLEKHPMKASLILAVLTACLFSCSKPTPTPPPSAQCVLAVGTQNFHDHTSTLDSIGWKNPGDMVSVEYKYPVGSFNPIGTLFLKLNHKLSGAGAYLITDTAGFKSSNSQNLALLELRHYGLYTSVSGTVNIMDAGTQWEICYNEALMRNEDTLTDVRKASMHFFINK